MRKLIFVYNADSGALNTAFDIAHKLISPSTYKCNLCSLTYGVFKEREEWKRFREESGDELIFLHKDEFEAQYGAPQADYPVVLEETAEGLRPYVSPEEIRDLGGLADLMALLRNRA